MQSISPLTKSANNKISPSTNHLSQLQNRIPTVSDKALINLVNGIQVNKDIIRYRKNRGFFGNLFDKLDGSNSKRRILLDGNIIAGQEALHNWVLELTDSLKVSQVALEVTQKSLLEARNAIRNQKQCLQTQEEKLAQLAEQINTRINNIETRLRQLEIRIAANEDLDRIITAWSAAQTYHNLPWVIQVALLAREVFSSAVIIYELETGDTQRFRELLVNKIIATEKQLPSSFFGIGDLLDYSSASMTEDDKELTASLLEIRSCSQQRLFDIPHLFIIGTTLEFAALPQTAKPEKPGQIAVSLCRNQIKSISRTSDTREFITAVVEETANDCLRIIQ